MMDKSWIEILLDWLPMLLLILVWIAAMAYSSIHSRRIYSGKSGKMHGQLFEESVVESRRHNDLLELLIKDQEARLQKLENRIESRT